MIEHGDSGLLSLITRDQGSSHQASNTKRLRAQLEFKRNFAAGTACFTWMQQLTDHQDAGKTIIKRDLHIHKTPSLG